MLQKLSYFNLVLAIIYLLVYLKSGTFNSTAGIFVIIVFSWLSLRSYELEQYKWSVWHYIVGLWSLYFVGTITYGITNVLLAAITYDFLSNDTMLFALLSVIFVIVVVFHFALYFRRNYKESKK